MCLQICAIRWAPRLRESRLLHPSGRGARVHATVWPALHPSSVQGDHSGSSQPPVDIKTKVVFYYREIFILRLGMLAVQIAWLRVLLSYVELRKVTKS